MLDAGLEKWRMGELPEDNEHDVPLDTMIGFRSMGGTLAALFDVDVVGRRTYDVHWRHCRVIMNSAHGVVNA
jgi:hypothetical protein